MLLLLIVATPAWSAQIIDLKDHLFGLLAFLLALGVIVFLLFLLARRNQLLRRHHDLHRLAQEATGVGVWDWDMVADCITYDDACWTMLGFAPSHATLNYADWCSRIHPDDLVAIEPVVQAGIAHGGRFVIEFRFLDAGDEWRWLQGRGKVVACNAAGAPVRMMGTHTDIHALRSERQRADGLLQRLTKLTSLVPGVVYQFQLWPDGRSAFPYASEGIRSIYGVEPNAVVSDATSVMNALHPDDAERIAATIAASAHALTPWHDKYRVCLPDGNTIWVEGEATPERRSDDSVIWHGYIRDVTRRERIEQALREKSEELECYFTSGLDLLCIANTRGEFVRLNPEWERVLGYTIAELEGRSFLNLVHPDDLDATREAIARLETQTPLLDFENRYRSKDGSYRWIEWRATAIGDRIYAAARDTTNRRLAEEKLRQVALELSQSNDELEKFAYAISHDLRQPLRMVNSYLQMLERRLTDKLDDDTRQMMHFASDGASRMDQMLVSLLEYSRVGRMGEPMAQLDSRRAVDEALGFLGPTIRSADACITVTGDWPQLVASRDEFTRLFTNLISNAIKYRVAGSTPQILVSVSSAADEWCFCVSDNGIGIDPAQFDRLFQVFQRLHTRDKYEGTGVGLAVARKIVERHGGRIWVESDGLEQGCRFCFVLPKAHPAEQGSS